MLLLLFNSALQVRPSQAQQSVVLIVVAASVATSTVSQSYLDLS